ncbi:type II secretion system protein GspC [Hydrocarboniphaga sp.]|uniref:type II secretion system protein GspC n=1 Tax=Hydrocarboniphaga sp. TaxID=2033016 RepID=UPI003D1188BD
MTSLAENLPRNIALAYERHGRWLPAVGKVLFALLLARLLAQFIWLWVPVPEASAWKPAPPAVSTANTPTANAGPNAELVAGAHLFGDYQAPADPQLDQMDKAPDTRLSLNLLGILAADRDKESRALIGTQDGEEKPYSVGDDVVRGVNLQAIFPDRVILSRNGQLETLRLDKDRPGTSLAGAGAAPALAQPGNTDTAAMLGNIRDQLLADPSKASDYLRIQPANINGQQRGYRIYPGRDRSVFNGAGLRPGDLVTSVNGVQLDDPSRALQMLGDLSTANTLNLTVERGGSQQAITVNLLGGH